MDVRLQWQLLLVNLLLNIPRSDKHSILLKKIFKVYLDFNLQDLCGLLF